MVFSDVILPDKSGLELVDRLLALKPDLKVLLGSGYTDEKVEWPLILARGFQFLQKPYNLAKLLAAVKQVLEEEDACP